MLLHRLFLPDFNSSTSTECGVFNAVNHGFADLASLLAAISEVGHGISINENIKEVAVSSSCNYSHASDNSNFKYTVYWIH